jgi:hypothetical protein
MATELDVLAVTRITTLMASSLVIIARLLPIAFTAERYASAAAV